MTIDFEHLGGQLGAFVEATVRLGAAAVPHFVSAVLLLIVGWWLASRVERSVARVLAAQSRIDLTLSAVIVSVVRYSILIVVLMAVLGQLGIQTTSILAALGAAGLAIGLAIQGTLSNIAAGIMILWLRPFRIGDYIDTVTAAGTVKEVGLFATEIHSSDGVYLFVPNSELWNKRIINYSRLPTRLIDLKFRVAYDDDLAKGQEVLRALAGSDARINADPAPTVFVDELGDSAVVLRMQVWALNADYWTLRRALVEQGKAALEAAGLSIPFPQRGIHLKEAPGNVIGKAA
jgi:small conductance mechanosensitive channel